MSKFLIKRHVSLAFLGEEYAQAYINFRAIPVVDYAELIKELPKDEQNDDGKSIELMLKYLKKYFHDGKVPNDQGVLEPLTADDLDGIDQQTAVKCFETVVGQAADPKDAELLTTPSSTNPANP